MNENAIQVELFPISCAEDGHNFQMADDGYYKEDENGERNKLKVFRMIYCTRCGENKEIMVVNRTPLDQTKPKPSSKRIYKKKK